MRDRFGEIPCADHAAIANALLLGLSPAAGNVLAGEVNDGIESGNSAWRDCLHRLPVNLPLISWFAANKPVDLVTSLLQHRNQRCPDQARSSADENLCHSRNLVYLLRR